MSNRQFGRDPEQDSGHNQSNDTTSGEEMKPWMQRILIGLVVTVAGSGIVAFSTISVQNLQASSRIETKMDTMSKRLDDFINVRYQSEQDRVHQRLLAVEERQRQE